MEQSTNVAILTSAGMACILLGNGRRTASKRNVTPTAMKLYISAMEANNDILLMRESMGLPRPAILYPQNTMEISTRLSVIYHESAKASMWNISKYV
jgi:hypothetical protein